MEAWYVECLARWTKLNKRSPAMHELGAWIGKSKTACWSALTSAEHKGHVTRTGGKFYVVGEAPS